MPGQIRPAPLRYGLALASFALILGVSFALERISPFQIDLTSMIIIAMIASAWYLGLGPGLVLAIILELTLDYFTPPKPTWGSVIIIFNRMVLFTSVVWFASSRRTAEKKLREQSELLKATLASEREARSHAEAADRLKDEFLATVSHELRTPLSAILGWSAMLNLGKLDEATARKGLMVIERNANAQAEIIRDILDVSRIISGKLRIDSRPVQLGPLIASSVDTLKLASTAKGISLVVSIDPDAGLVAGDPDRLQQIGWNLLSNAIKFTPQNGQINVELKQVDSHIELSVRDSGIGIEPDFLPHVFERFRQADSSTTRAYGGLGLGLAIVRHLVELHGGTGAAHSEGKGTGAMFKVKLPIMTVPASLKQATMPLPDAEVAMETVAPHAKPITLAGLRVLVVDDEADSREVLTVMLNRFGAAVRTTASSQDAFNVVTEWKPDVLLSDLGMPGEDGYQLITRIRALPP